MSAAQDSNMALGDLQAIYQALDRAQAIIEFDLDGIVVKANDNFLEVFGYQRDEIIGKHHRIFCDPAYAESSEYEAFWEMLGKGETHEAEFKRLAKDGLNLQEGDPGPALDVLRARYSVTSATSPVDHP